MHFLLLTATVIGFLVIALFLFAGVWVWCVAIRSALLAASAGTTSAPQSVNVPLPGIQLAIVDGKLVPCTSAFEDAAHAVHPVNGEVN
jgi:hypothetical protein